MSSFGYSVLGFGTVATAAAGGVAAPSSAVIKAVDGTADNVTPELETSRNNFNPVFGNAPADVGANAFDRLEIEIGGASIRISAIKTVTGTIATHAWSAVIASSGSNVLWTGGNATDTSSTSGTYTTPVFDTSSSSSGDEGIITISYTATNAGGSDAATNVVCYWTAV